MMLTVLLTTTIVTAQRLENPGYFNYGAMNTTDPALKNPITTQPVKNLPIVVPAVPICPTITTLEMVDKSYDKVMLGWNNMVMFDSIMFRYALSGTTNYRTITIPGFPNPGFYILQGLTPQTTYDFEIATLCHTGATSNWSTPLTLTTFAEPAPRFSAQRTSNSLRVHPNPATTTTTVSFSAPINSNNVIIISSASGREVYKTNEYCTSGKLQIPIDVSNINPGVYFLHVYTGTNVSVERLIVQ